MARWRPSDEPTMNACNRLARLMMPTIAPPLTTGSRLMWWRSRSRTASSREASSATVTTSRVITSSTLRPCACAYSSASWPGATRSSIHRVRCRSVPISARRRKSPSVTIPTSLPRSITGKPLISYCSISCAAFFIELVGAIEITPRVITSATFIAVLLRVRPIFAQPNRMRIDPDQCRRASRRVIEHGPLRPE